MENQEVKHYQVNGKYKVQYERSAVKGQDGFRVEANSDNLAEAETDAAILYNYVKNETLSNLGTISNIAIKGNGEVK
jgi:hypothetical protein